ncbi:MAG: response regulator [Polyangiaceae bacterium]|nr:response regulator [Polyangiaceae bacterium]
MSQRVLVVDDNEGDRRAAIEQLTQAGFVVEVATNGEQAARSMLASEYAVVLMGVELPVMDGYTATCVIRAWEANRRHTPIIALVASGPPPDWERARSVGMDDWLAKPILPDSLARALDRYVGEPGTSRHGAERRSNDASGADLGRSFQVRTP